jgi:hypothetical protein
LSRPLDPPIGASLGRIALRRVAVEARGPDALFDAMARMAARLASAARDDRAAPEAPAS